MMPPAPAVYLPDRTVRLRDYALLRLRTVGSVCNNDNPCSLNPRLTTRLAASDRQSPRQKVINNSQKIMTVIINNTPFRVKFNIQA